jgi:superfamily II DNA helicase RecQ
MAGEQLATLQGHGIIYTLTVRDANQVADWLKTRGFNVEAYTGETGDRREALEQALLNNEVKALVATTALGMGYDKPDLAFVIHYQMPGSVVAYYQQVGRAGARWTPPTACCSAARKSRTSPTGSSEARSRPDRKSPTSWAHLKKSPTACPSLSC